jgi:hypothetical protein
MAESTHCCSTSEITAAKIRMRTGGGQGQAPVLVIEPERLPPGEDDSRT